MSDGQDGGAWGAAKRVFEKAVADGMDKIACGGDTGVFSHGDNALEMKLMVKLGADWRRVLKWGTVGGWECIRSMRWEGDRGKERLDKVDLLREDARVVGDNEVPFGGVWKGFAADIIATSGDLERDFDLAVSADSIKFVMKGGRIFKRDGLELL
jgi:imidazolonepropionase-like amidohydrolase